jgi:predicted transcriptional regulator
VKRARTDARIGTFQEFQAYTIAVARGRKKVRADEPRVWIERRDSNTAMPVRFTSLEAGAKLLSAKNRHLLHLIATHEPQSVSELATLANRAPQNVQRTLRRLSAAGIVRFSRGQGRALRPIVTARKVHIEIDLAPGA